MLNKLLRPATLLVRSFLAGAAAEQNSGLEFAAAKSTLGQSTTGDAIVVRENPNTPEALRTGLAEAFANADYGGLHEVGGLH